MSTRDDYPTFVTWLEAAPLLGTETKGLTADVVKALGEIDLLRDLATHARHDEGCSAPFDARCKCGFNDALEAFGAFKIAHLPAASGGLGGTQ